MSEVPFEDEDDEELGDDQDAEIVPFPVPVTAAAPAKRDRHVPAEWKAVVPAHLRTREGRRKAACWQVKRARHHSAYHGVRSPLYLGQAVLWAAWGLLRIAAAQVGWWWVVEQTSLRHKAIADGDAGEWRRLHKDAREVRLMRGLVLLGALASGAFALSAVSLLLWIPVAVVLVPLLAWLGHPDDKPILASAVVPVVVERLSVELIVRMLGVLGITEMNKVLKEDRAKAVVAIDGPMRDGEGWLWRGDLPPGVKAGDVSEKREKREEAASALRRPLGCVWPETDHKCHPGALDLYVSDEDT